MRQFFSDAKMAEQSKLIREQVLAGSITPMAASDQLIAGFLGQR